MNKIKLIKIIYIMYFVGMSVMILISLFAMYSSNQQYNNLSSEEYLKVQNYTCEQSLDYAAETINKLGNFSMLLSISGVSIITTIIFFANKITIKR